ncbi:MAG TPA: hypothetical protein VNL91_11890 [Thermoanaerobaculia bacterium]|nr:hypothetical protein [Thermoanaerobaculia bacterium]
MSKDKKIAPAGFLLAAVLFFAAAFIPLARGGDLNAAFLALGVVFLVLAAAVRKKLGEGGPGGPPA